MKKVPTQKSRDNATMYFLYDKNVLSLYDKNVMYQKKYTTLKKQ